jgi:leucyl-tRNA synthetase
MGEEVFFYWRCGDQQQTTDTVRARAIRTRLAESLADEGLYRADDASTKPKYYLLDFSLSVRRRVVCWALKHYVPTDVASRFKRMQGYNVLHPMGWDAFGLPAENEAILRQASRREYRKERGELQEAADPAGHLVRLEPRINSSQPDYYRWTQWLFLLMYERGLAYRAAGLQWWCPQCKTILANEQVENGYCWRHSDQLVEKRSWSSGSSESLTTPTNSCVI